MNLSNQMKKNSPNNVYQSLLLRHIKCICVKWSRRVARVRVKVRVTSESDYVEKIGNTWA